MTTQSYTDLADLIRAGLRRDTWEPEYGSSLAWGDRSSSETIEINLERAPLVWEPIGTPYLSKPGAAEIQKALAETGEDLIVLDGVQRMHTRLLLEQGDRYSYSGLGTLAVGGLRLRPGTALSMQEALLPPMVQRCLLLSNNYRLSQSETAMPGLPYPFVHCTYQESPDDGTNTNENAQRGPEQALQQAMRSAEKDYLEHCLQETEQQQTPAIFLVDGPLPRYSTSYTTKTASPPTRPAQRSSLSTVVGYIKTLHTRYLPPEQHQVLYALRAGQRSPLFRMGDKQISWYMSLANPEPMDTALAGIVRLEVLSHQVQANIAPVQALADRLARILPALTLSRHEDPRAPQNLLPIHTLEKQLKMRMGHQRLIQRCIQDYFQQQDLS